MTRRGWVIAGAAGLVLLGGAVLTRSLLNGNDAAAQGARPSARVVPVEVAKAVKKPVPLRVDALGNVTPIASVAIKSRLETMIVGVHFNDGARVKEGDLLFTLDSRQLEAQAQQVEGLIARDQAQLEQAERDVRRYTELVAKAATPQTNLDNANTAVDTAKAAIKADQAQLANLKVQLSWCRITAPITGRVSAANVKVGNFVRPADTSPLVTINQISPVYVSFTVPQAVLPDIRNALGAETATVESTVPGDPRKANGVVTMIENSVDSTTGMVTVRATMPNTDELLWPGTLVRTQLTLRVEEAVTVPSVAVQVSQNGNFVFVINGDTAKVQPVKVERIVGNMAVIATGLQDGETVVIDGQLLLSNGAKVSVREKKPGA
jgi:multidrug efflux system membrane fusion protein